MSQVRDPAQYPRRIVCLSDETTEILYLLGQQHRIVGVSGYSVRPPEARKKPRVSAFTSANFDKIIALHPDLVLTYSDLQAQIAQTLIGQGIPVLACNQRSIEEIYETTLLLGRVLDCKHQALELIQTWITSVRDTQNQSSQYSSRPRVFFEEWPDPLISGIRWVDELVKIAGGDPIFPELATASSAKDRVVSLEQVAQCNPDVVIASWCGRKVNVQQIASRKEWRGVAAVAKGHIYEVKSSHILQPGPAALTDGLQDLSRILNAVANSK